MSTLNGGPGNIVTNGLVLYLDAANSRSYVSGSTVWRDLTTNFISGSLINGPKYSTVNGGSMVFDGIDDHINISTVVQLSAFTVSAWFNPKALPAGSSYPSVVTNIFNNNNVNYVIGWSFRSVNTFFVGYLNSGVGANWRTIDNISFTLGTPMNVTATFSSNLLTAYKNGSFVDSLVTPDSTSANNSSGIYIGRRWDTANYFNGDISLVQFYNRALSAAEILQNYNSTKARFGL